MAGFHRQALSHSSLKQQDFNRIIAFWAILLDNKSFCVKTVFPSFHRSARSAREIIPLDKWELLPEQIKYEEELGRGAFGVVYKATLKRRVGIEVFDNEKALKAEEPGQVVAVKELQGICSYHEKSCIKGWIVTWVGPVSLKYTWKRFKLSGMWHYLTIFIGWHYERHNN